MKTWPWAQAWLVNCPRNILNREAEEGQGFLMPFLPAVATRSSVHCFQTGCFFGPCIISLLSSTEKNPGRHDIRYCCAEAVKGYATRGNSQNFYFLQLKQKIDQFYKWKVFCRTHHCYLFTVHPYTVLLFFDVHLSISRILSLKEFILMCLFLCIYVAVFVYQMKSWISFSLCFIL